MGSAEHLRENRRAWDHWALFGSVSSRPIGTLTAAAARQMLDPDGWLPWSRIDRVLCLASGGGQQGPAFAMLGCEVTVVDLSGRQLDLDRRVAEREGLEIECVLGDMCDLRFAAASEFDLVYHPVSSCYVPELAALYRAVHRVLRPGGLYRAEHWNGIHMRIWSTGRQERDGYLLPTNGGPADPIVRPVSSGPSGEPLLTSRTFPHSLASLIGSLCDAGFAVIRLAEDGSGDPSAAIGTDAHLAAFVPPFVRLLARRGARAAPGTVSVR